MLQGPGENAGVIDLGGGVAVAFKAEVPQLSLRPLSCSRARRPGVGGILRDIIAMGARPVALLDGLRFGSPDWRFRRAVAGIGHYRELRGRPERRRRVRLRSAYDANPLVNAMCVGLLPTERAVLRAQAQGVGNAIVLYGAFTGRDGIGGASVLASQDLEGSDDKRPTVQIGDPFRGKALIEVSLELVESELVLSLQDCGAAGLASSLSEMARDGMGVDVHLDRVPLREADLDAWEIMISESRERMIAVVTPELVEHVRAVCERWELPCTVIGEVTDHGELRAFHDGEIVGSIPAALLTDDCPRYEVAQIPHEVEPAAVTIRSTTSRHAGSSSSTTSWSGHAQCAARPRRYRPPRRRDARHRRLARRTLHSAVSRPIPRPAARRRLRGRTERSACAAGAPLALTDCLNFGTPEKPEIGWELARAIDGITQAANELGIPVVSRRHVSLYNETGGRPIPPTPVVGCVGTW